MSSYVIEENQKLHQKHVESQNIMLQLNCIELETINAESNTKTYFYSKTT